MAELRLYTPEQVAERSLPRREQKRVTKERIVGEYRSQLEAAGPGFAGELRLDEGEDKRKIRALLKEAANQLGFQLRFRPIKDKQRIEFLIEEPQREGASGARRRGGRRKKSETNS